MTQGVGLDDPDICPGVQRRRSGTWLPKDPYCISNGVGLHSPGLIAAVGTADDKTAIGRLHHIIADTLTQGRIGHPFQPPYVVRFQ